ncbi:MAG: XdhC family protein [Saprospiraceae bacterium]|nr:XdhC family protein [Saprospiraceae bacterium]
MIDLIEEIENWEQSGRKFALVTVIETWRSAPRTVGACMIVDEQGKMAGSVSGGCVEGQVVKAAVEVIANGVVKTLKFGVSNDDAWSVGLSCGGAICVYVQPFFSTSETGIVVWQALKSSLQSDEGCVLIYGDGAVGFYSESKKLGGFPSDVFSEASKSMHQKTSAMQSKGESTYFFHVFPPKNHLVIIGAAHITRDLITLARLQDFAISVIDPRGLFYDSLVDLVHEERLLRSWPLDVLPDMKLDDSVFAVLLTHDPKIDDQALHILLKSPVAYIGALGSKKTQQKRVSRLLEAGFQQEQIDRIKGPVGLDIGASSPAEIALSIMAEIIKVKNEGISF